MMREDNLSIMYLGMLGVIKLYNDNGRLFKDELGILLSVSHPNIVHLIGYSELRGQGVLVFEHMPNGTLHEHLHNQAINPNPLSWPCRMSIAYKLACTIQFLHTNSIIHGDVRSSHVLLDFQLHPMLCGFTHASKTLSNRLKPSGCIDPYHDFCTGELGKKYDVYCFGLFMLELLTGHMACSGLDMIFLVSEISENNKKAVAVLDEQLRGKFDAKVVPTLVQLVAKCILESPTNRPSMLGVLKTLEVCYHLQNVH